MIKSNKKAEYDSLKITEQQLEVIESKAGIKRIIACAGSGKTLVLTQSIIDILKKGLCKPDEILAITFTKNAAENMRQRIKREVGNKIDFQSMNIFTFNAFGNYIISENSFLLGIGKNYRLINTPKSYQILYEIIKSYKFSSILIGKDISKFIEEVLRYIRNLKVNLISREELGDYINSYRNRLPSFKSRALRNEELQVAEYQKDLMGIYSKYEEIKKQNNFVDYNDHIFLPYRLLMSDRKLHASYRNRFKYIFIDEFQDTDVAQGYLISLLYNQGFNSLTIVGDDDQGIYSFRGACVENILGFHNWDVFSNYNVSDFYLTTNFRSGHNIVRVIESIIAENRERFVKELKPEFNEKYSEVLFFKCETHKEEIDKIVKNIRLLIDSGLKLKDIAILARRKRFKNITAALDKNNIRYEIVSGKGFFYEPEILFIISWLMIINNVNDEVYLLYLLQSGKYKISDRDLFFLKRFDYRKKKLLDRVESGEHGLLDGVINYSTNIYISCEVKKRLKEFLNEFNFYLEQANFLRLSEITSLIFNYSGLENELRSGLDRTKKIKIKNIETLIKISSDFELEKSGYSLESFIAYLKDVAKTDEEDPDMIELSESNKIKIMTIHAAKGLEFEAVFMPMLWKRDYFSKASSEKFKIPASLRKDRIIYSRKADFTSKKKYDDEIKKLIIEEERRIFYVGCSRAKKYLLVSYSSYENKINLKNTAKKPLDVLPFLTDVLKNGAVRPADKKSAHFMEVSTGKKLKGKVIKLKEILRLNLRERGEKESKAVEIKKYEIFNSETLKEIDKLLIKKLKEVKVPVSAGSIENSERFRTYHNHELKNKYIKKLKKYFSLTELLCYLDCPKKYLWKYIYNIPEPADDRAEIGQQVHKIIELVTMLKFENLIKDNLIKSGAFVHGETLNSGGIADKKFLVNCDKKLIKYLENYIKSKFFQSDNIEMTMLEKLFYWNLNGKIIIGKVDRLDIKKDRCIRIIDYKVSSFSENNESEIYINQLKSYTAGISGIFNVNSEKVSSFLLYLGDGSVSEFSFNREEIKKIEETLLETIGQINSGDFKARKKSECRRRCVFYDMC
ncbi:MAG: ATP-dependent helicase [Actinobacteria bacterium]|nr:ATP-dependent helicase [Actinomycetota bacterium]